MRIRNNFFTLTFCILLTILMVIVFPVKGDGGYHYYIKYSIIPITFLTYFLLRGKFKKEVKCLECDSENDR